MNDQFELRTIIYSRYGIIPISFFLFNEVEILRKDLIASIKEIVIMNSDGRCKIYLETQEKFCDPRFPRNASAILVLVW